jgi:peptidase M48-like protein/zinc ribbon protein
MAEFLPVIGEIVGTATFGLGDLFSAGLQIALLQWKRMSEFTADRAGLLACQDVTPAISAMMKIAGLPQKFYASINTEDFIAQARDFEALDAEKLNWLAKWLSSIGETHPWTVLRAKQFLAWTDSGEYQKVLTTQHDLPPPLPVAAARYCTQCGNPLKGEEAFCPGCGSRLAPPQAQPATPVL